MISVLYVDDEPDLLELGKAFLERDGAYSVTTVISAPDALSLMDAGKFDIILSDYQMPEMDGIALLKEIRSRYNDLPFILFTGRGREEIVIDAINHGADFYLQKGGQPLAQFAELSHKIRVAVERRQTVDALRDSEQRLSDIINFLPDATFAIDTEGTVIAWNRAIEEVTGVPASAMTGKGNYAYAIPFYGHSRKLLIDLILESEEVIHDGKYEIIKKEGDALIAETAAASARGVQKIFLCKASLLYNKDGEVAGAIESIRDITESKRAEDEIRAAYEQLTASQEELRQQYDELKSNQDLLQEANDQITAQEEELRGQYDEMASLQHRTSESRQMLSQVLNTVPVRVFWKDKDLRYMGCNEPFSRDAGFSAPADLVGKTDFEMGWKEQAELYRADDRKVIETGVPKIGYEEPQTTPDGKRIWLRTSKIPLRDTDGTTAGILGTYEDITNTKLAEEALRESEEKYRSVIENVQDIFYRSDRDGNLVMASPSMLKLLGYGSFAEILNKPIASTFYYLPEKRYELLRILAEKGYIEDYEVQLKRKDGTPVWVSTYSHHYLGPDGGIAGIEGVFRDIRRRKEIEDGLYAANEKITAQSEELEIQLEELEKANQALLRNEENFQSLVESAPDAIYISIGQRFVYVNAAFVRMLGATSRDQLLGMSLYDRIHPDYHAATHERADLIISEGKSAGLREAVYLKMDGSPINVESAVAPFRFHGQRAGLIILRDITERKRAQQELRLASMVVENSPVILFRWKAAEGWPVAYVSQNVSQFGYTAQELVSGTTPFAALVHTDDIDRVTAEVRKFTAEGTNQYRQEYRIVTRDGRVHWVDDRTIIERDSEGNAVFYQGIVIDITVQKEREEALRESEILFRRLLERSFDAALIHQDGVIVFTNDQAAQLMKTSGPGEIIGKPVMDFVDPASEKVVRERIKTMYESPDIVVPAIEERFRCMDGTNLDVEVIASPTIYQQKPSVLVLFRDISDRKAAETALKESEKRYRQILQHASDAIIIHEVTKTKPGRVIEVNDKACRMLGYTREELLGLSIPDIDAPEQAARVPEIQDRLFSEGTVLFQTEHITKEGKRIPVEVNNSLITLDGRQVVLAVIRDMSTQRRTEQVLRETNRKLGLLSSITRHDLRNKVTLLSGYLTLAKQRSSDPSVTGYIDKLVSVTGSMSEHIEFTKIYEDLGSVEPLWQDIREVISRQQVPPGLTLEDDLPVLMVFADPILPKVFSNLIDNTVRHGKHATTIQVSAKECQDGISLVWEDNGTGIPANHKEKIFDRGFGKNTGLGLFLSREILAITGITIRETGEPGKGARFEILVPTGAYRFTGMKHK